MDRIFGLHRIFTSRRTPILMTSICEQMECSISTARRAVRFLRDQLNAPLVYDVGRGGWWYDRSQQDCYELPGLWFNPEELYALLVSYQLLSNLKTGFLYDCIAPFQSRIEKLLEQQGMEYPDLKQRIRILQMASRPSDIHHFRRLATSLLRREQVKVLYHGRERDITTERVISPQRLVYYRSNWYLDAWCHNKQALRTFSLDRLHPVEEQSKKAKHISSQELDEKLGSSYGIFSGKPRHKATLLFSPEAARWVADEQWHPQQNGAMEIDGSYLLTIPYNDSRELMMDILKYGSEVEVKAPKSLREAVANTLRKATEKYY